MAVSRETTEKLKIYKELLIKWSSKINLVSPSSLKEVDKRHFEDCLQLVSLLPKSTKTWIDLGSGGGFPGAVVAIALAETDVHVTLIESDARKATFLKTVSRETQVPFTVISDRFENLEPLHGDVVSARALAPLNNLFLAMERHAKPTGTALFMKGKSWPREVSEVKKKWQFSCVTHKSITDPAAAILEIGDLSRV